VPPGQASSRDEHDKNSSQKWKYITTYGPSSSRISFTTNADSLDCLPSSTSPHKHTHKLRCCLNSKHSMLPMCYAVKLGL